MLTILFFIVLTVVWLALILLRALRFERSGLTDFEMKRRIGQHDADARRLNRWDQELPLLQALKVVVTALVIVLLGSITAAHYGLFGGALLAMVLLYVAELLARFGRITKLSHELFGHIEYRVAAAARTLSPILGPITSRLGTQAGPAFYSKAELVDLITQDQGVLSADEKLLVAQSLQFKDKKIVDVMIPRRAVDAIDVNETLGPVVLDRLHQTGHSRFPVIDRDIDHVVGMLYIHNLVPLDPHAKRVRDAMEKKVYYVHQDQGLDHALHAFLRTKHHLFIVVNDFSEVVGLITIEDCLEQILGRKIVDEFDAYDDLRAVAARDARHKPEVGEVV